VGERPICAVSVDLDEIDHYRGIHGLPSCETAAHGVYDVALARIGAFASELDLPLTLFAVGRDLERSASAAGLLALTRAGHEVENHSYGHRYDLSRLPLDQMDAEVGRAQTAIEALTGRRPVGFRAPGYTLSNALLGVVERQGLAFDSSSLPCPSYYLAKLGALGWMALKGRQSHAIVGSPRAMSAPRAPYRPAPQAWHRRGGRGLYELPISVTRLLRLPFIGTSVTLAGPRGARLLARGCGDGGLVNFELHGVDFLDRTDGLEDLVPHQPDVRLSTARKLAALTAAIDTLRRRGYRFVTLATAFTEMGKQAG